MKTSRTELSALGEFGLIDRLKSFATQKNPSTRVGIGDDAAVIDIGDQYLVVSKDLLIEGIHFDLAFMPLKHVGHKAVSVNISDIAAMNAKPEQIFVGLGVSNRFSIEAVEELYEGMRIACEDYGVDLAGGDTVSTMSGIVISITAIGRVAHDKVTLRSGGKPNDIICLTGDVGAAYMGLQVMEREKQVFLANPNTQPVLDNYEYIVGRLLKPTARMDIIHELADAGVTPTAMIDVSDGLSSELLHIAKQSGSGVKIFEDKIPIDNQTYETALEFKIDPITCALHGGDDYELLFTIRQTDYEAIKKHPDIHFIGHLYEKSGENVMISKAGTVVPLKAKGWNHFG